MVDLVVVVAVAACLAFSLTLAIKWWASRFHRSVAGVALASAGVCVGERLVTLDPLYSSPWFVLCLLSEVFLVVMLFDTVAMLRHEPDSSGRPIVPWQNYALFFIAGGLSLWVVTVALLGSTESDDGRPDGLGWTGHATYLFVLTMYAVDMAYVEGLFRTLRDPIRYQLKFVLIGLAALAGFRVFALTQTIFYQGQRLDAATNGTAMLVVVSLMAYGFSRVQFRSLTERVYISPKVLYGSVTFLVVGLYLFVVGIVSQIVRSFSVPLGKTSSVLFVFLALVALVIVLLSRSARMVLRTVVARNFYRSKYDYRAQWLEVTEVFRDCDSEDAIWDGLLGLLSRTFCAGRISVWRKTEADARFYQVRTTNTEHPPEPLNASHELIRRLAAEDVAVEIEASGLSPHEHFIGASRAALYVPIRSGTELIGFIILSSHMAGLPYDQDDRDLLKAITHHVGILLAHLRLAEERQGSAELEALHRFSAFCLHDLKNLAARLSLVVQNAEHFGDDPAFQESAMRTVKDTAQKMTTLMSKLSRQSITPTRAGTPEMVELSALIEDIVAPLRGGGVRWFVKPDRVQPIIAVREEIHQVLLNVVLNAKQSISEEGEIRIVLAQLDRSVIVTVEDTGSGISSERMRSLFRPVQSTRAGGLGIGLYQCRQIVEAHGGMMHIRSQVGQGTIVHIELPLLSLSSIGPRDVMAHSVLPS